ncbi:MAG: hypothetical protein Q9M32_03430 [Sulfurimonas sp.]|nr:hypothetical protein [Sulfurimonas sp.]MDQ7060173.1 hypothetical protein [Sulfurimonas sp.]
MQVKFEFVSYDDTTKTFELDENIYSFELNEEQAQSYELFKDSDLHLYNWFKESESFTDWIKEEVYPDSMGKIIAICDIDDISYRRYYFFKITSADSHYEYFKKLFDIYHEEDWQDREEVGATIIENLVIKRKELFIELKENVPKDA